MIELYHCAGARSFRCIWALEEIGLPYALHNLKFPPRLHAPAFLEKNPAGTVPFFVEGDAQMTESSAILEYLALRHDGSLALSPQDPSLADILSWTHFGEASLTTWLVAGMRYGAMAPPEKKNPAIEQDFFDVFRQKLDLVDAQLKGREFLCADRLTIADISVTYPIMLARLMRAVSELPSNVGAYFERMQERPGYKAAAIAHKRP